MTNLNARPKPLKIIDIDLCKISWMKDKNHGHKCKLSINRIHQIKNIWKRYLKIGLYLQYESRSKLKSEQTFNNFNRHFTKKTHMSNK